MVLRSELIARQPDPERVAEIARLTAAIIDRIDANQDCASLLEQVRDFTGRPGLTAYDFAAVPGSMCINDFAVDLALPVAQHVPDITRQELAEVIRHILSDDLTFQKYYIDLFERNVPMRAASDLIYHPEAHGLTEQSTPEEIAAKALSDEAVIRL